MRSIQENILSMIKEHKLKEHLAFPVAMIAIATVLVVAWSLHINGITLASDDPTCGMQEHVHTESCYGWVALDSDGTESVYITEDSESTELAETSESAGETEVASETESSTEAEATSETESAAETENAMNTEIAEETESSADTETVSGTESAGASETAAEAAVDSVTESVCGTESLTEMQTENATEDLTENSTEDDTESPQLGDTRVANGVTYVYELVCGMEEHVHTEDCYASDESEGDVSDTEEAAADETTEDEENTASAGTNLTAGVAETVLNSANGESSENTDSSEDSEDTEDVNGTEEDVDNGIATISEDDEDGNNGIATVSEDDEEILLTSGSSSEYYFADATTLADASDLQDEGYIIYTVIDSTYYLVSADGSLVACTYLGTVTDTTTLEYASNSSGEGIYCWTDENGNLSFKCTAGSTYSFGNYEWNLTSSNADSDGAGTYSIYNSDNALYLAPENVGVSESLSGKGWWSANETGQSYELNEGCKLEFTIDCTSLYNESADFTVEIFDSQGYYITTNSNYDSWYFGGPTGENITNGESDAALSIKAESTYTVTVERGISDSGKITYIVTYYDTYGAAVMTYTAAGTNIDGGQNGKVYVHIIAQVGAYDISVATYKLKSATGTTNSSVSSTYSNATVDATTSTAVDQACSDSATLAGDFDVTFSFYNEGNYGLSEGNQNYYNYILAINNGKSEGKAAWYVRADEYAYSSGANDTNASVTYVSESFSYVKWNSWRAAMTAGVTCYVRVVRKGNTFTITQTAYRNTAHVSEIVYSIEDDAFQDCAVTMYLTGIYTKLTKINITNDAATYDWVSNDAYNATGTIAKNIVLSESNGGFTASSAILGTNYYLNIYESSDVDWTSTSSNVTFYLAKVRQYTAWFDETNGGITVYKNLSDTAVSSTSDAYGNCYITVPTQSGIVNTGYTTLQLRGWYDIYNKTYYEQGDIFKITGHTVLYADWIAGSYDNGSSTDSGLADTVSTSSFITATLFDMNELFNLYTADLAESGTITSRGSTDPETVTLYTVVSPDSHNEVFAAGGMGSLFNSNLSLNFMFFRTELYYFASGATGYNQIIDYPSGRDEWNQSKSSVTQGIIGTVGTTTNTSTTYNTKDTSTNSLLTMIFGTGNTVDDYTDKNDSSVIYGKTVVGTGDYLFKYNETTGYYSYDSSQNGASYNQTDGRFYVYEDTADINNTTYFLPLNVSGDLSSTNNPNYWFGMSTEIQFYLTDEVPNGETDDEYGKANPSKDSTDSTTYHTTFKFSGDDDVWVFVDGVLVLDLGGVHGKVYGEIDFSTGEVIIVNDGSKTETTTRGVLDYTSDAAVVHQNASESYIQSLTAGSHTLSFYYLERGAGESNAAIYFNISSTTYNLDLSKVNEDGATELDDAEFTFYMDSGFTELALLATKQGGEDTTSTFKSTQTVYGLREGKTYYVVETKEPDGYSAEGKYFTVMLKESVLTITVYDSTNVVQEQYVYTIDYDSTTGTCSYTCVDKSESTGTEKITNNSPWDYVLEDSASFGATISGGAIAYYSVGIKIANTRAYELPTTGSMGIFPYRRAGTILVIAAGLGLGIMAFYELVRVRRIRTVRYKKEIVRKMQRRRRNRVRTRDHPLERSVVHGHARDRPGNG